MAQRPRVQSLAVVVLRQALAAHQMDAGRRRCATAEVAVVVADHLAYRAEVLRRATTVIFLLTTMVIATVIVLLALRAATVRSATLVIRCGLHQGTGAEQQHTQTGYHTLWHLHQGFPQLHKTTKRDFEPGSKSLGLVSLGAELPA